MNFNYYLKNLSLVAFAIMIGIYVPASKSSISLYGSWKVKDYRFLLPINNANSLNDRSTFNNQKKKQLRCLGAKVIIVKNSIKIFPSGVCDFIPCDTLKLSTIKEMYKLPDSLHYKKFPGEELVLYGMVSQDFLDLLKSKENKIHYIDTNCFCENGNYTLKIIIVNSTEIVLFSGMDITFLERIKD